MLSICQDLTYLIFRYSCFTHETGSDFFPAPQPDTVRYLASQDRYSIVSVKKTETEGS